MVKRLILGASVVALSLVAAPTARAQVGFGISAGASLPRGDIQDVVKTGYSVNGLVGFTMPLSPLGFRGEVGYNAWDSKQSTGVKGTFSSLSGTGNLVLQVPGMIVAKPYLIGGVGAHRIKVTGGGADTTATKFGWNVGGGINFGVGALAAMLEARYVVVSKFDALKVNYVPVTFGIMF